MTELGSAWWCWTCGWLVTSGQGSWWWIWGPSSLRSQGSLPAGSSSGDPLNHPECSPPSPPCLPSLAFHTGYPSVPGEGSPLPQPSPADRAGPRLRSSLWSPSPLHFLLCQPGGSLLGPPWHCCPTCRALGQRGGGPAVHCFSGEEWNEPGREDPWAMGARSPDPGASVGVAVLCHLGSGQHPD